MWYVAEVDAEQELVTLLTTLDSLLELPELGFSASRIRLLALHVVGYPSLQVVGNGV